MDQRRHGRTLVLLPILFALACATKPPSPSATSQFVYCPPATFANCTIAKCEPKDGGYACNCFLDSRYSATSNQATCVKATSTTAQSRYHPVSSYQLCTDPLTVSPLWAWCLGMPCNVTANGDVLCKCTVPPPGVERVPYVVVTSNYLPEGCKGAAPGRVWSSATPGDVEQITDFLRQQPGLQGIQNPTIVKK